MLMLFLLPLFSLRSWIILPRVSHPSLLLVLFHSSLRNFLSPLFPSSFCILNQIALYHFLLSDFNSFSQCNSSPRNIDYTLIAVISLLEFGTLKLTDLIEIYLLVCSCKSVSVSLLNFIDSGIFIFCNFSAIIVHELSMLWSVVSLVGEYFLIV